MSSKKTTVTLDEKLLHELDLIADALDVPRNKVIADALADYSSRTIDKAKAVLAKQEELKQLKEGL